MSARKKYNRMVIGRNHKFETDAADIRFNLSTYFLVELFGLFVVTLCEWVVHLLDKVSCIVFHPILNVKFLFYVLSFSLLIPLFPFLLMLLQFILFVHFSKKFNYQQ